MFSDLERQERPWADLRWPRVYFRRLILRTRRRDCVSAEWCAHATARGVYGCRSARELGVVLPGAALVKSKSLRARTWRRVPGSRDQGGFGFAFGDWAPRRLGAQEPLRVGCPRVCIELMYQSSGYRTRFDIKQALTSINQPPPASSVLNDPEVWKVHDEIARSEAFGLRRRRQWGHNNGAMPYG